MPENTGQSFKLRSVFHGRPNQTPRVFFSLFTAFFKICFSIILDCQPYLKPLTVKFL